MRYLLDTHIFVWWMLQNKWLDKKIGEILENPQNDIFLSVVSIWEIVIKNKNGKLKVPKNWNETLQESGFTILPIELDHAFRVETLPQYHKDPFDRMLIAQAIAEKFTFITTDVKIKKYAIPIIGYKKAV